MISLKEGRYGVHMCCIVVTIGIFKFEWPAKFEVLTIIDREFIGSEVVFVVPYETISESRPRKEVYW